MTGYKAATAHANEPRAFPETMTPPERLYYLDALRAFCMLFGLFVHAATLGDFGWLEVIPFISEQFRMATFFAASAMLSVIVLRRRPTGSFVQKRLIMLLVPFVSGVVLLNPLTLWLIWQVHATESETFRTILFLSFSNDMYQKPVNLVWHLHLWFLVSLAAYAALTPALDWAVKSVRSSKVVGQVAQSIPEGMRILAIAFIATFIALVLRIAGEIFTPQLYEWWLTRATLINVTYFATGILIANSTCLMRAKLDPLSAGIATLLILLSYFGLIADDTPTGKLVSFCSSQFINVSAIFFLLWVFRKLFDKSSALVGMVIRPIYTVYIFHYFLIYAVGAMLCRTDLSRFIVYIIAVIVAFFGGLVIHKIVTKVSLLSFLFNGKMAPRRGHVY